MVVLLRIVEAWDRTEDTDTVECIDEAEDVGRMPAAARRATVLVGVTLRMIAFEPVVRMTALLILGEVLWADGAGDERALRSSMSSSWASL